MNRRVLFVAAGLALGALGCGEITVLDHRAAAGGTGGAGGEPATTSSTTSSTSSSTGGAGGGGGTGGGPCVPVDDGNLCTDDFCNGDQPAHSPVEVGIPCSMSGAVCDGMGACVGCLDPSDCPGDDGECQTRACTGGVCGMLFAPAGTMVAGQLGGDCLLAACDGTGSVGAVIDDSDLPPDDGNACTDDLCVAGMPVHPGKVEGTACDDGDPCTSGDGCKTGACAGNPVACSAIASCVVGACVLPACSSVIAFTVLPPVDEGWEITQAAMANLNDDGLLDLVIHDNNFSAGEIDLMMANGDGTFSAPPCPCTGYFSTSSFAMADVNGDGVDDRVEAPGNPGIPVGVALNGGAGQFSSFVSYPLSNPLDAGPYHIVTGDLNGDGMPDLALVSHANDGVSVLLNHGDGTFEPSVDYPAGPVPRAVAMVDVKGDGMPALVVVHTGADTISVLLNHGDGTFEPKADYLVGSVPSSVAGADLNGDGKVDLVVANSGDGTVSVLRNHGDGTFEPKVDSVVGVAPSSIVAADLNGDGKMDLAVTNTGDKMVSALISAGDGTFACKSDVPMITGPTSVSAGDLDGDGKVDLLVTTEMVWGMESWESIFSAARVLHNDSLP